MPRRNVLRASALNRKATELAVAVPHVVAHRLTRMALAGPVLSPRDRREFTGMVAEKQQAFVQSWLAMFVEATRAQQQLALAALAGLARPGSLGPGSLFRDVGRAQHSALAIASKGLAPVHRKAVSNSKRLARTKLR